MSIGFCTDVRETHLVSKAFTIIYIILGASVIGGALALFIQDVVEGLASPSSKEYQILLERHVFNNADIDHTGVLNYQQFERLIRSICIAQSTSQQQQQNMLRLSSGDIQHLWTKFDRLKDGVIHFEEFSGSFRCIDQLVESLERDHTMSQEPYQRLLRKIRQNVKQAWNMEHRVYVIFALWIAVGVSWGMFYHHWDIITSTHFAVSALATGGLTAPEVDADGFLPAEPAIFCGIYCLLGIPLFALTLGHFARALVAKQVAELERAAWTKPLTEQEFDFASHLTTKDDVVHLSDFIVLMLLRRGKLTEESARVLKENFEARDTNGDGVLSLEQALAPLTCQTGS